MQPEKDGGKLAEKSSCMTVLSSGPITVVIRTAVMPKYLSVVVDGTV